jgi:hypothetical protein
MAMSPELEALMKGVLETQEQLSQTLLRMNEAPNVATPIAPKGIEEQGTPAPAPTRRYITPEERIELSETLRTKSDAHLGQLFTSQARVKDQGIPLDLWLNTAGFAAQNAFNQLGRELQPDVAKALDTAGATALIRQDLEPVLYEVFVRQFPAYDRMPKEPANGLLHAWNQITAYGDAKFMAELGTVTDDTSTYARKSTNIAILATRRGISLKSQFAVMAGGMNYNPEAIELQGGLRAMAYRMQKTIFEGQAADSGGTADNELGLYDANAFTGLRSILNTANAWAFTPSTYDVTDPTTFPTSSFRNAIDAGILPIVQAGGMKPSIMWGHPSDKIAFDEQQDQNVRLVGPEYVDIGVGATAQAVNTLAGRIPFAVVPGDSISSYQYTGSTINGVASGSEVRDLYILDESTITLPYLGSPGPTVLEIPVGISGQLTHLYIVFLMNGLAVKVLPWNNKVRVKLGTWS